MYTIRYMRRKMIYKSHAHLAVTIGVVLMPFLFLLLFSQAADIATGKLFMDVFISLWRLMAAYIISAVIGWLLAIAFYRGKRADFALPAFDLLQSFPTFAVLPLATLAFGASNTSVIFFLVITVVWPILFSILSSLKLIKNEWYEAVQMSRLKGWNYFRYFLLPVSVPGLITGSIVGIGEGWEALVATEIVIGMQSGLGGFFKEFSSNAAITGFGVLGLLLIIFSMNKLIWLPLLEWSHKKMEE